jgi:PAS domain S-box-containing protein
VTSPASLYRAAAGLGLRRAIPGLEVLVMPAEDNRLRLDIRLSDALRPCPQLLHITTGAARALPRLLEMPAAIVTAKIEDRHAGYEVTIPSSRTGAARLRRMLRSILSPGSALQQLEDRQLELEARHARLARAHEELLERERRFSALSDAAVDTICEIDASGRILFISASVRELMGYSREQVTDSHYRLWVTTPLHGFAKERFESLQKAPVGTAIVKERIELHAAHGRRVTVEVSLRSHCTASGEWRAVACLRDAASPVKRHATRRRVTRIVEHVLAREEDAVALNGLKVQSGTRSMSAPRARSFSSIRS